MAGVVTQAGQQAPRLALPLQPGRHHPVRALDGTVQVVRDAHRWQVALLGAVAVAVPVQAEGQECRWSADDHLRTQCGEPPKVGARHAAVRDVADDDDPAPAQIAQPRTDGKRVEQGLRWVRVPAVSRVADAQLRLAGGEVGRAPGAVAGAAPGAVGGGPVGSSAGGAGASNASDAGAAGAANGIGSVTAGTVSPGLAGPHVVGSTILAT